MSLQRNLGERRTCNQRNLYCVHYRLQLQAFPTTQRLGSRRVPGEGKGEEETNRDSSVQAFSTRNQSSVCSLEILTMLLRPSLTSLAISRWKGKGRCGDKKKKDQDSEANNVINISLFQQTCTHHSLYIWSETAFVHPQNRMALKRVVFSEFDII